MPDIDTDRTDSSDFILFCYKLIKPKPEELKIFIIRIFFSISILN